MNERHGRNVLAEIETIRRSLDAISKAGLSVSDAIEQRFIWRTTSGAAEAMRALEERVAQQHPHLAPHAYIARPERATTHGPFIVRRLDAADLAAYRELQRFALSEAPAAFVETPADEAARPDAEVEAMLQRGEGWGLFDDQRLVGKAVLDSPPYESLGHTRWVHAVYVRPEARGGGAAAMLLNTAIDSARADGALVIALWVNAENRVARSFYERLWFREGGRVPRGIRVGGRYVDDVLMVREA